MTAKRTITISCNDCSGHIISSELETIPAARDAAKSEKGMKVRRANNGSMQDLCFHCAIRFDEKKVKTK